MIKRLHEDVAFGNGSLSRGYRGTPLCLRERPGVEAMRSLKPDYPDGGRLAKWSKTNPIQFLKFKKFPERFERYQLMVKNKVK